MITLARLEETKTKACFWNGPLVVNWIFLLLWPGFENAALWILMIFLFGSTRKASLIFRMFTDELVA